MSQSRNTREAFAYVIGIRNKAKASYAMEYLNFLRGAKFPDSTSYDGSPNRPDGLSYMGAQAVRMNLLALMGASEKDE